MCTCRTRQELPYPTGPPSGRVGLPGHRGGRRGLGGGWPAAHQYGHDREHLDTDQHLGQHGLSGLRHCVSGPARTCPARRGPGRPVRRRALVAAAHSDQRGFLLGYAQQPLGRVPGASTWPGPSRRRSGRPRKHVDGGFGGGRVGMPFRRASSHRGTGGRAAERLWPGIGSSTPPLDQRRDTRLLMSQSDAQPAHNRQNVRHAMRHAHHLAPDRHLATTTAEGLVHYHGSRPSPLASRRPRAIPGTQPRPCRSRTPCHGRVRHVPMLSPRARPAVTTFR